MMILPAMDVMKGRVVRLRRGQFQDVTQYSIDVADQLRVFEDAGLARVHIVDLTAAAGDTTQWPLLQDAARGRTIHLQVGGGIRTLDQAIQRLKVAERIVVGTAAFQDAEFLPQLASLHLQERIVLAVDVEMGRIRTHGWTADAAESPDDFLRRAMKAGFVRFLCTDISRDGMMRGPNVTLYQEWVDRFPELRLIASGGVSSMKDVEQLKVSGVEAVVIGRAYYDGCISLEEIRAWNGC